MQIEVGKKYEDAQGRLVEIVARNDKPAYRHKALIGLLDRGDGSRYVRCYGAKGEAFVPLVREHVPFKLEVGKAYAARNGNGYGVVINQTAGYFVALVASGGGSPRVRTYADNGSLLLPPPGEHGFDLVPGPIFPPGSPFGYEPVAAAAAAGILAELMSGKEKISEVMVDHTSAIRTLTGIRFEIRQGMGR